MFDIGYYTVPAFRYNDYQFFFRRRNREKFKSAIAGNPSTALGLLLVMNRELISKPESELRKLLDAAAVLDIPGVAVIGDGIWKREEWATRLLPESSWKFPEQFFEPKRAPSEETRTLETLIADSEQRKNKGREYADELSRKARNVMRWLQSSCDSLPE